MRCWRFHPQGLASVAWLAFATTTGQALAQPASDAGALLAPTTYTPIARPGAAPVRSGATMGSTPAPVVQPRPSVPASPVFSPAVERPRVAPSAGRGPGGAPSVGQAFGVAAVAATHAAPSSSSGRRFVGLGVDVGMPDGLLVGLVLLPSDWLRLQGAIGSNSASIAYRAGASFIPVGWGPSFTTEVGHCNLAATTSLLRSFFSVAQWMQPYVQQLGYTYVNAHLGFDYPVGDVTLFLHGGYTYLMGTIHAPEPVLVEDKKTGNTMTVTLAKDGDVRAYTLSAKLGLVYRFGGI